MKDFKISPPQQLSQIETQTETKINIERFSQTVLSWYHINGRKNLPWQESALKKASPYRVWISEIMLQQTQVITVIPYFKKFMQRFPTLKKLAQASQEEILYLWSGLGYYARARNLHKTAQILYQEYQGKFPHNLDQLISLPGIGRSTAGAIRSLGIGKRGVILDGNVKRVITRYFGIEGWTGQAAILKKLWQKVEELTPSETFGEYNQAMMDLGATCCTRSKPNCTDCPLHQGCYARNNDITELLPTPKKSKAKKQLERHFLILINPTQQILLVKRPNFGLWGGLWIFPEFESQKSLQDYCKLNIKTNSKSRPLPIFDHIFTHIQLKVNPHLVEGEFYASRRIREESDSLLWYDTNQPTEIGLSAMITKVLTSLKISKITGLEHV